MKPGPPGPIEDTNAELPGAAALRAGGGAAGGPAGGAAGGAAGGSTGGSIDDEATRAGPAAKLAAARPAVSREAPTVPDGGPHRPSSWSLNAFDATLPDAAAHPLDVGARVGRYTVLRELGRGGMGVVYAAHDGQLDRQVALKVLHPASSGEDAERLVGEAQALARLSDPHVVSVFDAGELDGCVFIAMQLVDGEDLATAIRRRPSPAQAIAWFVQAGKGLAASHAAGLVHRDFKPSNVLVDHRGHVAVTDFGLARPEGHTDPRAAMMGTPAYMAPEQHGLQPATPASDQFAFCVSLWEALFAAHPFIREDRGAMSPFAIGYAICSRSLALPDLARGRKGKRIPRRVVDALVRGLARDPAARWPSMRELLDELVPAPAVRPGPIVAGVGATIAIALAAAAYARTHSERTSPPPCETEAASRIASAWSADAGRRLAQQFERTGPSYAPAARAASAELERYAVRWAQQAGDVCAAERAASGAEAPDVVARKRACLDARLDALRGVTSLLTGAEAGRFAERAERMVDGLGDLAECADAAALLAAPAPPPAIEPEVRRLEREITEAALRGEGGDMRGAVARLGALVAQADRLTWPATRARARIPLGELKLSLLEPARGELIAAANLATEAHLDREAARAWALAAESAGLERSRDALELLAAVARGAAARVHDRLLDAEIATRLARARLRDHQWQEGAAGCRAVYAAAPALDNAQQLARAHTCIIEALVPLGAYTELEPILATALADSISRLGPDHPRVADFLAVQAVAQLRRGRIAEARVAAERALGIRERAFEPRHQKIADALDTLADVTAAEGKPQEALALYERALALTDPSRPEQLILISGLHIAIASLDDELGRHPDAIRHYEEAVRLVRARARVDAPELAVLLLNYGQSRSLEDVPAAIKLVEEARDILARANDPRAVQASIVLAVVQEQGDLWPEVRATCESVIDKIGPSNSLEERGTLQWVLAKALVHTGGDRVRAKALAEEGRKALAALGPAKAKLVQVIDRWIAAH